MYPGNTEVCDGIDNDCDGVVDDGVTTTYYADADKDGYGDPGKSSEECEQPSGYVTDNTDCDDTTNKAFPGNEEICDKIDNNCDGTVDEGVTTTYYADIDGDGYGNEDMPVEDCSLPMGYSANSDDCDDTDPTVNPAADEYCNGVDDNCDGRIDEGTSAWDDDGDCYCELGTCGGSSNAACGALNSGDCNDGESQVYPGATEVCNSRDEDCDGAIDEFFVLG